MLPTTIQPFTLLSDQDGLPLSGLLLLPQEETVPCGILQVSHGIRTLSGFSPPLHQTGLYLPDS